MLAMLPPNTFLGKGLYDELRILENGDSLLLEKFFPPLQGWEDNGGLHLHSRQDEHFEVLGGILTVRLGEEVRTYVSGERFELPKRYPHALCNLSSRLAQVRWEVWPALNTANFIRDVQAAARKNKCGLLAQAALAWEYREVYSQVPPPFWTRPVVWAALAWIRRLQYISVQPSD